MSEGIVSGFTGRLAPSNLATNGSFLTNQRGNFSSYSPAVVDDYVSDAWKLNLAPDFLEVISDTATGRIGLRGNGKKGQEIKILNKDLLQFAKVPNSDGTDITASLLGNFVTADSVKVSLEIWPRFTSGAETRLNTVVTLDSVSETKQAVRILKSNPLFNTNAFFVLTLLEDGEFDVEVNGFSEIDGAYANPPRRVAVNLADDLARCQRWYQKGNVAASVQYIKFDTEVGIIGVTVPLRPVMAAIPTISVVQAVPANSFDGSGGAAAASGVAISATGSVSADKFRLDVTIDDATHGVNSFTNGADYNIDWTAEIV